MSPSISHVLHRSLYESPHHVTSSSGINLTLTDGTTIIDGSGGASISVLGHTQTSIVAATASQMSSVPYVYSMAGLTGTAAEALADAILSSKPGGLRADVVRESAAELSREHVGALSVSGHTARRWIYEEMLARNVSVVAPCYAYRCLRGGETGSPKHLSHRGDDWGIRVAFLQPVAVPEVRLLSRPSRPVFLPVHKKYDFTAGARQVGLILKYPISP